MWRAVRPNGVRPGGVHWRVMKQQVNITAAELFDALEARILNFEMRCFIYSSANLVLGLFPSIQSLGRVQLSVNSASLLSLQELNHVKPAVASLTVDVR